MAYLFFACAWPIPILAFVCDLTKKPELREKFKDTFKQDVKDIIQGKTKDAKEVRFLVIALVVLLIVCIAFHYLGWLNKPIF